MKSDFKFPWHKVDIRSDSECWNWLGSKNIWGYGTVAYGGKSSNASRIAFIVRKGEILQGNVVCHTCDNPACCNPSHLFQATQAENLKDCRDKGRQVYLRGKDHHRSFSKLTVETVLEAKRLYRSGWKQTEIAKIMGVDSSAISRAVRNKSWSHVE